MGESVCEHTVNIQRTHSVHTVNTHSVCVNAHCSQWTHMFTDFVSSYSLSDIYIDSKCLVPCIHLPICLYLCLSVCLSICLSTFLSVHLSVCLQTSLSVSDYYYICLSIRQSVYTPIPQYVYLCPSIYYDLCPPLLSHSLCIPDSESLSLCHQHILQTKLYVC